MAMFNMVTFGVLAAVAVRYVEGVTTDGQCTVVYLAMILGVLTSIAQTLRKKL